MFKSKLFYAIFVIVMIVLGFFYYKKYRSRPVQNEAAYFMRLQPITPLPSATTTKTVVEPQKQLLGILILTSGIPTSLDMVNGVLCLENSSHLDKVEIYMPDMGHGGEPPKVTATNIPKELVKYKQSIADFGCYSIESMQLFMPGLWQVRPFYKDGAMGVFNVDLKK